MIFNFFSRREYKIAAFIVNYNMPERADDLSNYIKSKAKWPVDIYLIDNSSDLKFPAKNTTVWLKKNVQTCNGWLEGMREADCKGEKYFAYWFLITSARFVDNKDPLSGMVKFLINNKDAVGIHPSLTKDSTTAWGHLINRGENKPRRTWMIDNIASLYRADWFDSIGRFDKEMIYAWGVDLETCYLARKQEKSIWVDERIQVEKINNIGYTMNRMNMSAEDRSVLADKNMREILEKKYGKNYWDMMMKEGVLKSWK